MRLELGVKNWRSYLPIVDVIANYRRVDFDHDLVAGLVLGMVTVPQAVAYAFLAGVPPQAGLYACLFPMVVYAILGSSRHLVVGPVAVAAIMVAATVGAYAPRYSDEYLAITTIICLQAGIVLWLLRLSNMGGLVNLLSHPVITGFVNAASVLIILAQVPALTGISTANGTPLDQLISFARTMSTWQFGTLVAGVISLVFLFSFPTLLEKVMGRKYPGFDRNHPIARTGPMLAAGLAIAVVVMSDTVADSLATVGAVPAGLPSLTVPSFDLELWLALLPSSAIIALVAYVESYSIGATLAARERTRINSHQELIALGAANITAAFSGAYPVAGSFSRSSVNYQAGARTPVSSFVCAGVIMITLLVLTPLFQYLPEPVLAAIVIVSVVGLMDFSSLIRHWSVYREDTFTEVATFVCVLALGVEYGLMVGVALSLAFFIRRSSRPNILQLGRVANSEQFRSVKRHDVETIPEILVIRVDENLYFANANQVEDKLMKRVQRRPGTQHLLMVCSSMNLVDITGFEMLARLNANLLTAGVHLHLCEVKSEIARQIDATELKGSLSGKVFFTADRAMRELMKPVDTQPEDPTQAVIEPI